MITFEVIEAAASGDPVAARDVLDYFDGYIDVLCTHAFIDDSGRAKYGVDTHMKSQLQGCLLHAILVFKV